MYEAQVDSHTMESECSSVTNMERNQSVCIDGGDDLQGDDDLRAIRFRIRVRFLVRYGCVEEDPQQWRFQ